MTDIFHQLDAKDGFHVIKLDINNEVSLHCQAYSGGELVSLLNASNPENATVEIKAWPNASEVDHGEATRLHLVLDSIARYLTTGGNWEDLENALLKMRKVAMGNLEFQDYHLLDTYSTTEGTYQHIFVRNDTDQAVLWEEPSYTVSGGLCGGFIDHTTLEQIRKDQEDAAWGEEGPEAQEDSFQAQRDNPLQLQDRSELETEEKPD